jgi:formylglycine-generating enzyme required for sulfatase activity
VPIPSKGIHDQAGNVWEWCSSIYREYRVLKGDGPDDPESEGNLVVRGGSWDDDQRYDRCAYRGGALPDDFVDDLGFRVVLSLADSGS